MLTGLWRWGMTAPCAGHPCSISAGDGRSFAIGVSCNCNRALAREFGDPSVFLYVVILKNFTFFTMASMNPFDWWKWGEDVWCMWWSRILLQSAWILHRWRVVHCRSSQQMVQIDHICIMILVILTIDEYIIMNCKNTWALCYNVIHPHLKYILAHLETKWDMKKLIPTEVRVEHCEYRCSLSEMHSEKCLVSIHFRELCCSCQVMSNFFRSDLLDRDKFSTYRWVSLGTSVSLPMVSVLFVSQ